MRTSMPLFLVAAMMAAMPVFAGGGHGRAAAVHGGMSMPMRAGTSRFDSRMDMRAGATLHRFVGDARIDARDRFTGRRTSHGNTVSTVAHDARGGDVRAGSTVRATARSRSQGPTHANVLAIDRVANSKGRANENSVLGTAATSPVAASTAARSSNRTTLADVRSNSQGPLHAADRAIDRVANNPGRADGHSVLAGAVGGNTLARDQARAARRGDDADDVMDLQDDGLEDFDDGD